MAAFCVCFANIHYSFIFLISQLWSQNTHKESNKKPCRGHSSHMTTSLGFSVHKSQQQQKSKETCNDKRISWKIKQIMLYILKKKKKFYTVNWKVVASFPKAIRSFHLKVSFHTLHFPLYNATFFLLASSYTPKTGLHTKKRQFPFESDSYSAYTP